MIEKSDKELLDALGVEVQNKISYSKNSKEEYVISGFEEIQAFFEKFKRIPENNTEKDIHERILAARLNQIKINEEILNILKPLDNQGLINKVSLKDDFIDENLDDEQLLKELEITSKENNIFNLKFVRSSQDRKIAELFANREKCENFEDFKHCFDSVQTDLEKGLRKTSLIKQRPQIKKGMFFILSGLKTFVADVGDEFMQDYGISDARLYLVFDNGTESRMLLRSFQKALSLDEGARIISNNDFGPLFSSIKEKDDQLTGTIYVLRSKSSHPYILENRQLIHKIGITTNTIEKRISGAKLSPTYLMADVEIVASYKLYNLKISKFENLVKKLFSNAKLNIKINDRFGNPVIPEEWFLIPLDVIKDAIQKIIEGSITKYIYDPSLAKMVEIKIDN